MRKTGRGRTSGPDFPLEKIAAAQSRGRKTSTIGTALLFVIDSTGIACHRQSVYGEQNGVATVTAS